MNIMILLLQTQNFALPNITFLEKKINMIMDGFFVKLYYSDECMTMNGIYIEIPITNLPISSFQPKNVLHFDININKELINKLSIIEKQLIQYYMFFFGISNKTPIYSLKQQLQNGCIKYYTHLRRMDRESSIYYIKISGIWENSHEIGITFKVIEGI